VGKIHFVAVLFDVGDWEGGDLCFNFSRIHF
jgi:hypothetical protein